MITVTVARRPTGGHTIAESALSTGCGQINVDACRVSGPKGDGVWGTSNASVERDRKFNASPEMGEYRSQRHDAGRWPANLILEHQSGCQQIGTDRKKFKGLIVRRKEKGAEVGMYSPGVASADVIVSTLTDADGLEEVEVWDCASGCPVADLDTGVDTQPSKGQYVRKHGSRQFLGSGLGDERVDAPTGIVDAGGASRFFKWFGGRHG